MAKTAKTVILDFQVDLDDGVKSIERLRNENKLLTAERNKLNTATKEGRARILELNATIDKNSSIIKTNSNALEKQRLNIGKYKEDIIAASKEVNIAGVNVGGLSTKLSSFINPATAAAGAVSALSALYAKSAFGANDLASAQAELGVGMDILANKIGNLGKGDGIFTSISKGLALIASDLAGVSRTSLVNAENAAARLRGLDEKFADAARIRKQTEKEAEDARRIRDDEEKNLTERLNASNTVEEKLKRNEIERVKILREQVGQLLVYGESVGSIEKGTVRTFKTTQEINFLNIKDKNTRLEIKKAQAEIADIQEEINGKLTENIKSRDTILGLTRSEAAVAKINAAVSPKRQEEILKENGKVRSGVTKSDSNSILANSEEGQKLARQKYFENASVALAQQSIDIKKEGEQRYTEFLTEEQQARLAAISSLSGALSGVLKQGSDEMKATALFQIGINSGISISEAVLAGAKLTWPENLVAIASGITAVLAGIGQARSVLGFADGGWTGPGDKYKPVGIVHADEYVVPKHIVRNPAYAGNLSQLERARVNGYADGGLVSNRITSPMDQQILLVNALKSMPQPVLSIVEFTRKANKLKFKENQSQK